MQAPQQEVYQYVLKMEKDAPANEQTIWHLKIMTAMDSSSSLRRYAKAFKTGARGESDVIEPNYKRAYRGDFLDIVKKVENYQFGYKFPELQAQGYLPVIEEDMISKVFEELPDGIAKEIIDAGKGEVLLGDQDRKK
jgi:hypothetical protein